MSRDYKNFEVHDRKSLDDPEEVVCTNVGVKGYLLTAQKEVKLVPEKPFITSENINVMRYIFQISDI